MILCPCDSGKQYKECCQPIHDDDSLALTPEQLMRARYCAYRLSLIPFIIDTYHTSCLAEQDRAQITDAASLSWVTLEILTAVKSEQETGYVEFKASYIESGKLYSLHEKSRFTRQIIAGKSCWRYIDGEHRETAKAQSIHRNTLCPCRSGKKFKRCCQ